MNQEAAERDMMMEYTNMELGDHGQDTNLGSSADYHHAPAPMPAPESVPDPIFFLNSDNINLAMVEADRDTEFQVPSNFIPPTPLPTYPMDQVPPNDLNIQATASMNDFGNDNVADGTSLADGMSLALV